MSSNVVDLTEYMPRGGYITTNVPFIFNINDVVDIQNILFEFQAEPEPVYMLRLIFTHGDHIDLIYPNVEAREIGYNQLVAHKAKSKFKVLDGKQ